MRWSFEQTLRMSRFWATLRIRRLFMENKDQEKKRDEVSEKSKTETIEKREKEGREKQNARLAERKGQRKAFPFKRESL